MNLLSRPAFIDRIRRIAESQTRRQALIYGEINYAIQVASLLQGSAAEEELIAAIQKLICKKIEPLKDTILGQLDRNRFGLIVNRPVKESVKFAEDLVGFLDRQYITIGDHTYYPKLTLGVTELSPEYETPEMVLAAVDEALYQARRTGNSVVKLIDHDNPQLRDYCDSLKLLPVLRKGLIERSFVLYSQPIVSIAEKEAEKKAEILLRYHNQQGEMYSEKKFLKTAQLFHISREVDLYVLHQFCRFMAQQTRHDTVYSLNISGSTVRNHDFVDSVVTEFKRFGVNPEQVCFEIPETVADTDYAQAIAFMHLLKDRLGCRLSLDDIGVGSSNLANLSKYNVDFFKIDGAFISEILENSYSELVIGFITTAAKMFDRKTIAEHVENRQQLEKIKMLGVDYTQGYLTGMPELLFDPSQEG